MPALSAGMPAPQFTLPDQHNQPISLSDFQGKRVVIYFYPKAMTPGCTLQAQGIRDFHTQWQQHDVTFIGISPDSPERLLRFQQKEDLNFILLSDSDHRVAQQFGAWGNKKFMGKSYEGILRISFLIDESGTIIHLFDKFKTRTHNAIVLDYLIAMQ